MRTIERHSIVFASYVFGCNVLAILFVSWNYFFDFPVVFSVFVPFFLLVYFFFGGTIHTTACFLFVLLFLTIVMDN